MTHSSKTGHLSVTWPRRQWLKVIAVLQDYPKICITVIALAMAGTAFYATRLDGLAHFTESFSRWRVENFGGEHEVDRAVRVPDVILSFPNKHYDRIDILSMTSIHFGGRAFEKELNGVIARGGIIRVVGLDPRLGEPQHPNHSAFTQLAEAFGDELWEFRAQCWHSTAVLVGLHRKLGERFQVRLISNAVLGARAPYMSPGRWSHSYQHDDDSKRMDVIIERPDTPDGRNSFVHEARVFRNRPEHPDVKRFSKAFGDAWKNGALLDDSLTQTLLARLNGAEVR